ncbi:Bug family tripartite tricarboxylate transporter substrate binding protein [Paracraurococcus ruber]|nr:tripartite tricarboxylate transporter substrate-binding protein [Paracraurococcus ruber]TDG34308.1 tripartite tricarboxylate transporter substrate binding protein [Paracraurococcus ruber]
MPAGEARRTGRRGILAVGLAGLSAPALAQGAGGFPSRPIRMLVGFAPGGATDIIARTMQQSLSEQLGQPVLVENRAGASGMIATQEMIRAAPDGHTLGWLVSAHAGIAAIQGRAMPYDAVRDITPITMVAQLPAVVAVPAASPARSLPGLIALARETHGGLSYSTSGPGGWQQFGVVEFGRRLGLGLVHVPYRGGGPSVQALLAGEVGFSFATPPSVHALLQAGSLRGLAVTGPDRSPEWPDLPTVAEAVPLPGFQAMDWYALAGPPGLPAERVERLAAAVHAVLAQPEIAARLRVLGTLVAPSSPAALGRFIGAEVARYAELAQATGIRLE